MGKLGEAEVLLDQGDEIVRRMKKEVRSNPKVIATGGLATLIVAESETIGEVNEFLTLQETETHLASHRTYHIGIGCVKIHSEFTQPIAW